MKINNFWEEVSFEEHARRQGVRPVERIEELLGGWPEDQIDDGFEDTLEHWRGVCAAAQSKSG
jgi:hypothetical protein